MIEAFQSTSSSFKSRAGGLTVEHYHHHQLGEIVPRVNPVRLTTAMAEPEHLLAAREGPRWLEPLLRCEFFGHCKNHTSGKHEKNQFCLDCCAGPFCPEGLTQSHGGHASVQVRKASHRDVIRIVDIQGHLDISNIQFYTINSAKIIFLQSRPQPKVCKGAARYCDTCHRSLADQVRFCSINCKLVAVHDHPTDTSLSLAYVDESYNLGLSSSSSFAPSVSDQGVNESIAIANLHEVMSFSPCTPRKRRPSPPRKLKMENNYTTSGAKRRKKSAGSNIYKNYEEPVSPMSVLAPGGAFAHDWVDYQGPTTPESYESSPRVHPRKQFHPHRAPFF